MKKIYLALLGLFLSASLLPAQSGARKTKMQFPRTGTVNVSQIEVDYRPLLQRLEAPYPGGDGEKARAMRMKEEIKDRWGNKNKAMAKKNTQKTTGGPSEPWISTSFRSNTYINGVPNDNDMAISNGGYLVSVINSNIFMHDSTGATLTDVSLDAWAASLNITGSKFDPRALYDPVHDRFVISCLNGFTDSTSYIIVGFSETNDPTGNWHLYALPGDPRGDSLWTDYPIMAFTQNELFITGNLLYNDQPWQTGFARSLCWQIDLDSAYLGGTLETMLWDSVFFQGKPIRNLCPIQGGSMPGGPNLYLLSNRNFAMQNDTVWIMEITDSINGSPAFLLDYGLSDVSYGMPPNGIQRFNQQLATNDARWLDGFVENGNIQFVGNTVDTTTGKVAVYHGTVTDVTGSRTVTGKILGDTLLDYGYPAICWMGMSPGPASDEAMIGVNFCGPDVFTYPGCGAFYYDGQGGYSDYVRAKTGESWINAISGIDRWGDYFGIQTKYNQPGVVWIAGTYGLTSHLLATWVAEFNHPSIVRNEVPLPNGPDIKAFPNPTYETMAVEFRLDQDRFADISIYDMRGVQVKTLVRDRVRAGLNRITFSTDPLAAGTYFLRVAIDGQPLKTEKILKLR